MVKCNMKCEVFSRVVGYHRPIQNWNRGKREEFEQRVPFSAEKSLKEHKEMSEAKPIECHG